MSPELLEAPVGAFFKGMGWAIVHETDEESIVNCDFILDDHVPEFVNFPRIKTAANIALPPDLEKNVRGVFDQSLLDNIHVQRLLHDQFNNGPEYDFIERYSQNLRKVFILKIHEYLNIGYFIDSMVIEAYKAQFDYDQIRAVLNELLLTSLKDVEFSEIDLRYIEVSYSFNENAFAVQVTFDKKDFNLQDELLNQPQKINFYNERSQFFEINHFSKRNRLTISVLWFRDQKLKNFHSYFFNEITTKIIQATSLEVKSGLEEKEEVIYNPRENAQAKKLGLARKIALFIRNYRKNEESPKSTDKLEILDVEYYMTQYPRQEALSEIDNEIKGFILKLLKDENLYDGISDFVKKIAESNLNNQTDEIKRILSGKSLSDIEETLMIHGKNEDLAGGFTRVKGASENTDDFKQTISGVTQDLTNDQKWEVQKLEISQKIEDEVSRIKADGRNVLKEDIIRVVSNQLDASEEDIRLIVGEIVVEAVAKEVVRAEVVPPEFFEKREAELIKEKAKCEAQIVRMKKVMEQMKNEMLRMRDENLKLSNSESLADNLKLKNALAKTMTALKNKDKMLEKIRADYEAVLSATQEKIHLTEERLRDTREEFAKSVENANVEKITLLEKDKEALAAQLELANKKINVISDNMDNKDLKDSDSIQKRDKEILTLKTSISMAQTLIERFKKEKAELELRLSHEAEHSQRLKDEYEKLKTMTLPDRSDSEEEIQNLMLEKRKLEEQNKTQARELKSLEQKLKFATSKMETELKRKTVAATSKGNEAYIKQLEIAGQRMSEATAEIAEKKKEAFKLKQENSVLLSKVAELEKKLAQTDKKAA